MITFLSAKLRFLLLVLLAIVGISFVFFGSWTPSGATNDFVGEINGNMIGKSQYAAAQTGTVLVYTLQTGQMVDVSGANFQAVMRQTFNRMLILGAANQAGLSVAPGEVAKFIQKNPLFQKDGKYQPAQFEQFKQAVLDPQGISMERLSEIVENQLLFEQIVEGVTETAFVPPSQADRLFNSLYAPATVSVIEVGSDAIRKGLKATPEELQAFYDKNKDRYQTPEIRQIEFVEFNLAPADQKLKDKPRQDALQALGTTAYSFSSPFIEATQQGAALPDFRAAAQQAGLQVKSTKPFTLDSPADAGLPSTALARAAFNLTTLAPISDILPTSNGFVVLRLVSATPAQPKPFATVEAAVRDAWTNEKTQELTAAEGSKIRDAILAQLQAGKTWKEAVTAANATSVEVAPFVPADAGALKVASADTVRSAARSLETGELSPFLSSSTGGVIVFLHARGQGDAAKRAEILPRIRQQLEQQQKFTVTGEWLGGLYNQPGTKLPVGMGSDS
jgi:peptidyl-prolyl cis-trans isomerase D